MGFVKKLGVLSFFALLPVLLLAGCVGVASKPGDSADGTQKKLVVAGLSQDLIYEYLLGDIAARRGDPVTAAGAMTRAAELSSNLEITLRAFCADGTGSGRGCLPYIGRADRCAA